MIRRRASYAKFFLAVAGLLYLHQLASRASLSFGLDSLPAGDFTSKSHEISETLGSTSDRVRRYVDAILDPQSTLFPRLECPLLSDSHRYASLLTADVPSKSDEPQSVDYFFAMDLRNSVDLLPRLLGSVVEAMRFLGPSRCALSIVEGNSQDDTRAVLEALRPHVLGDAAAAYYVQSTTVDPLQGDRVGKLAALRNSALQPLWSSSAPLYSPNTTVIFLNDVAACAEDILELIYQRRRTGATMTCGFDWAFVGPDPTFYDVWIARGMTGDTFFEIPPDGSWDMAWLLFWNDPVAIEALAARLPFQVFSCWNGATVFSAAPLFGDSDDDDGGIRFRAPTDGECVQGEPQLFCKDLWTHGYGKIAVVPSVHLAYSDQDARKVKQVNSYTSEWTQDRTDKDEFRPLKWSAEPPAMVKCMPSYDQQSFRPWNESL